MFTPWSGFQLYYFVSYILMQLHSSKFSLKFVLWKFTPGKKYVFCNASVLF